MKTIFDHDTNFPRQCITSAIPIKFDSNDSPIDAAAPTSPKLEYLLTETRGRVAIVTLHRPKALNALCNELFLELNQVMKDLDNNNDIGAIVLTGSERAFAGNNFFPIVCYQID